MTSLSAKVPVTASRSQSLELISQTQVPARLVEPTDRTPTSPTAPGLIEPAASTITSPAICPVPASVLPATVTMPPSVPPILRIPPPFTVNRLSAPSLTTVPDRVSPLLFPAVATSRSLARVTGALTVLAPWQVITGLLPAIVNPAVPDPGESVLPPLENVSRFRLGATPSRVTVTPSPTNVAPSIPKNPLSSPGAA